MVEKEKPSFRYIKCAQRLVIYELLDGNKHHISLLYVKKCRLLVQFWCDHNTMPLSVIVT